MSDKYLPPGVSDHMIPGNRPEDEQEEKFWETLIYMATVKGLIIPSENWWEPGNHIRELVNLARGLAYTQGFQDGVLL